MGQVRPGGGNETRESDERGDALRKKMTEASTPTPKPTPLRRGEQRDGEGGMGVRFDEEVRD